MFYETGYINLAYFEAFKFRKRRECMYKERVYVERVYV
jgi:hypothetical protein